MRAEGSKKTNINDVVLFDAELDSAIREGNVFQLEKLWKGETPEALRNGMRTDETDRHIYIPIFVNMNGAAIAAGADPQAGFDAFDLCMKELKQANTLKECFHAAINGSFAFCKLVSDKKETGSKPEVCKKIESYINMHIRETIHSKELSEYCFISERQLSRIFLKVYGMSMRKYLNKERLRQSTVLLKATDYTISEISRYFGFVSQSYYTKLFTAQYGCTPSEYRIKKEK